MIDSNKINNEEKNQLKMKVLILAGGFGTRLGEYTETIPKPMVSIGGKPIIWHIMKHYAKYDHTDFNIALGYKAEIIKEYFLKYRELNSNFCINLNNGLINFHENCLDDWSVNLVDTGLHTMTGGRVKRMQSYLDQGTFMLTYGDGISDINLDELLAFHRSHGKMVTITAVRPGARFGELELENNKILSFKEKPQLQEGWINGGFFVIEPEFLKMIEGDEIMLEREPLELASEVGELMAYKHNGFWQCMDTKRDRDRLEKMWLNGHLPWIK